MAGILEFDTRGASAEDFARALFDRPVGVTRDEKESSTEGEHDPWFENTTGFVELCTHLFLRFGELSAPYSVAQVNQAMWFLHGDPYFLQMYLTDEDVAPEAAISCVWASYHIYADFLAARQSEDDGGALFMWWDEGWNHATPEFLEATLQTLTRILDLPNTQSRRAALHGLSHLQECVDSGRVQQVIDAFLNSNRGRLSAEVISYAAQCREGRAL